MTEKLLTIEELITELRKLSGNTVIKVEYNQWLHNHPYGKIQATLSIDDAKKVLVDDNTRLEERIKELEKEIRILKITYAKCRDCKHANMYSPDFAFLVIDPRCELDVKPINSDTSACEDFELIGRCSR